jgi:hypothetical protein
MRPDPGSDPLAASDHWGRKDLLLIIKWCFATDLQDEGQYLGENSIPKKNSDHPTGLLLYMDQGTLAALYAPATSLWRGLHGARFQWRQALPHPI